MARIVVAEDDPRQTMILRRYLERDGHVVHTVPDGDRALIAARAPGVDLLILDVLMPGRSGLEVCRALRLEGSTIGILMLTALSTEDDLVRGLAGGADDYLRKPYSARELLARSQALLRRSPTTRAVRPVVVGALRLDPGSNRAEISGRTLEVTPSEFRLLEALARTPGVVHSRRRLLEQIQGDDTTVLERTIDVHIRNLRVKLRSHLDAPRIRTAHGLGYRIDPGPGSGAADAR